jgi:hypothetical protein
MKDIFAGCEIISSYTRADAIADGTLIDITGNFPDISHQLYKYPVACTATVWAIVEAAVASKKHCNNFDGVVWDLLWMSQKGVVRKLDESQHIFRVIIMGADRKRYHDFKIMCHGGDQAEPVLTIMQPWED